jgi:HlyD family secretion protein
VDEVDVARVAVGQPVTITLDALPRALLQGRVEKIAPVATNNQGVVSYIVRLTLDPPADAPLRGGMTATAEIVVAEARDVVLVPNWAIRRDRDTGQTFVGVLRDGRVEDVPVILGLRTDLSSEVLEGVNEGEVVAVDTRREEFRLLGGGE